MTMPQVAIMVPAYNAGKTMESVFERIPADVHARVVGYGVVNDGSSDDTAKVLCRLQSQYEKLCPLHHDVNRGYGAAEKTLLDWALTTSADVLVLLHSDGQYAPEEIPRLLKPFESDGADIVQGSRMMEAGAALRGGMPRYKYVANRLLTALENIAFGMQMAEYHSGYMLYSRRVAQGIPYHKLSDSFCFDQEMLVSAHVKGYRIAQLPIPTHYGEEVSHLNPIQYGINTLAVVWAHRRRFFHKL